MDHPTRLAELRADLDRETSASTWVFRLLVLTFAVAIAMIWYSAQTHAFAPNLAFALAGPAYFLLWLLSKIQRRAADSRRLTVYYERLLTRRENTWSDDPQTGEEYANSEHLYSPDIDLFGRGSLFQFMCTARSGIGRDALARYMTDLAPESEAKARADAVGELLPRTDLREQIALVGGISTSDCRTATFTKWLGEPAQPVPAWAAFFGFLIAFGIPVICILALVGTIPKAELFRDVLSWAGIEGGFYYLFRHQVANITADIGVPSVDLRIIAGLIKIFEARKFTSPKLKALSEALHRQGKPASRQVARLRVLVWFLNAKRFLEPITFIFLWETQFATAIERWRTRNGQEMLRWLEALGEFEALNAISAYAYDHPEDVAPEFVSGPALFDATALGHPLIDPAKCVRNDVTLGAGVPLWIISGSNMSGKSTLLRACGLAVVLASMGAPVRAKRFRLSNLALTASIRLHDSLLDGRSKFYVEVARLKAIIDLAAEKRVLFLVDEVLSGTNSHDRRIAAEWTIRALVERGAIGLLTTHDLALTQIADEPSVQGRNVHLADSSDSGGLDFDYTLRPGIIHESNALAIVKLLGIPGQ